MGRYRMAGTDAAAFPKTYLTNKSDNETFLTVILHQGFAFPNGWCIIIAIKNNSKRKSNVGRYYDEKI